MSSKSSSRVLTDHEEIRSWAEERGARPAMVQSTSSGEDTGIIRLDFPGYSGEGSLEEIEWDEWFEKFDENNLALIVQEQTANGQKSNFNKLMNRENVDGMVSTSAASGHAKRSSASGSSGKSSKHRSASTSRKSAPQNKSAASEKKASSHSGARRGRSKSPRKAA